jgi:hypothetical protein
MIADLVSDRIVMNATWMAVDTVTATQPEQPAPVLPDGARSWLAALRLLSGVPFQHLVPDERLLPQESVRFFYIDRGWTDALVQGALSVGAVTDADRALLAQLYSTVRDDIDRAERRVRVTGGEGEEGAADVLTGMLLRSRAVSGYPGIHVNAYRGEVADNGPQEDPSRLHTMRMEQLAPSVLFVIFDGAPTIVHVDEPRHGIQFGVDENGGSVPGAWKYQLSVRRNAATNGDLTESKAAGDTIDVPFRANAPGVIDLAVLQQRVVGLVGGTSSASEFAIQMIRLPYRQVYGPEVSLPFTSLFASSLPIATIRTWPGYAITVPQEPHA